jgi:hypothetical protein
MSEAPTSDQLALREARRLKKQQAKAEARAASSTAPPAPLVNLEKGQITPRSWLTVQDGHQTTSRSVRIMTWNVRDRLLFYGWIHRAVTCRADAGTSPALGSVSRP